MEQAFAKAINLGIICYNCPFEAYQSALKRAVKGDIIVVFGSFFTVSSVMTHAKLPIQEEVIV
jgi:dihydrofolate synthase/folylpolyglutamate synthase